MKLSAFVAAAAVIGGSFLVPNPAEARTCIRTFRANDLVCIHGVYSDGGPQKRVVMSANGGKPGSVNIDCRYPYWESASILDRACSDYSLTSY